MKTRAFKIIFVLLGIGVLLRLVLATPATESATDEEQDGRKSSQVVRAAEKQKSLGSLRPLKASSTTETTAKLNGLWAMVDHYDFDQDSGKREKGHALPPREQNRFYLQIRKTSVVWMTQITAAQESELEYSILAFTGRRIRVSRHIALGSSVARVYELALIELDAGARSKKVSKKSTEESHYTMELKEVYDRTLQKVVSVRSREHEVEGTIDYQKGKIANFFARINGVELKPTMLNKVGKDDYDYGIENEEGELIIGKAQATLIGKDELNFYFISGNYRGYTLIFTRKLSDEELYRKQAQKDELAHRKLSRENSEFGGDDFEEESLTEEEAVAVQEKAIAERKRRISAMGDMLKTSEEGGQPLIEEEVVYNEQMPSQNL